MGNCQKSRIASRHLILDRYHSFCDLSGRKNKFKINDFDDDTLLAIFSALTLKEKLAIERVCKRWQQLIRLLLQSSASIKLGEHSIKCHCQCVYYRNWDFPPSKTFKRDKCGYIVYPNSVLRYLSRLCTNLKCINLSHCYLDDNALKIIMQNNQLECLHLYDVRLQEVDDLDDDKNSVNENHNRNNILNNKDMQFDELNGNTTNDYNSLMQWKLFSKKLGQQLKYLSIGSLTAVDQLAVNLLLKYCHNLVELTINNEIDIISYLAIIKKAVKRININCEHGIGLECISLLAFRNYAEKVVNLGRVDVPPELIDSVISTIGSNFSNLKRLMLRLRNFDIDVTTPADVLFDQLEELSLQFVSGNVDVPFQKILSLGWSSIKCLTIQYASLTRESVQSICFYLPQLEKLVLHAVEFRCDHLSKRYGHRLCIDCGRHCWKSIAQLPKLRHLRLHRVIIDDEICSAINLMPKLRALDLHYCSNVNENIIEVCTILAKQTPQEIFTLCIVSRGFLSFTTNSNKNFILDIRVAFR